MGKSRDILSRPFIRGLRSRDGGVIASECRVQLATRHPLPPARNPPPPPPRMVPPARAHTHNTTNTKQAQVRPPRATPAHPQLSSAYHELANELGTDNISVVGNYTLGRVIGQGNSLLSPPRADTHRHLWLRPSRHPQAHRHPRSRQKSPQVIHPPSHPRAPPPPPPPPPPHCPSPRDHRHRVPYMARHGALQRRRAV